jgi:hypothetical protein
LKNINKNFRRYKMDKLNQNLQAEAGTAEAEQVVENMEAAELGKFKDVKSLMDAYTNLEAEFTRRSQRLKELENANKTKGEEENLQETAKSNPLMSSQGQEVLDKDKLVEAAMQSEDVKNAVIAAYLQNAAKNKGVQFIAGGVNVPAQRRAPVSVKEAGRLAQEFLNKREN